MPTGADDLREELSVTLEEHFSRFREEVQHERRGFLNSIDARLQVVERTLSRHEQWWQDMALEDMSRDQRSALPHILEREVAASRRNRRFVTLWLPMIAIVASLLGTIFGGIIVAAITHAH